MKCENAQEAFNNGCYLESMSPWLWKQMENCTIQCLYILTYWKIMADNLQQDKSGESDN